MKPRATSVGWNSYRRHSIIIITLRVVSFSYFVTLLRFKMDSITKFVKPEDVRSTFYKSVKNKKLLESCADVLSEPSVTFEKLSTKQALIVKLVREFLQKEDQERKENPLRLLVIGTAGTGKTAVISHLKSLLHKATQKEKDFKYEILSFTGLASYNAGGSTIHSTFNVKMYRSKEEIYRMLDEDVAPVLKSKLNGCRFFIIDEISTVGKLLFRYMERCLCEINPQHKHEKFGATSFVLFGDFAQLPAIDNDYPLFKILDDPSRQRAILTKEKNVKEAIEENVEEKTWNERENSLKVLTDMHSELGIATRLYMGIKKVVILDKTFRQNEDKLDEKEFASFLQRLRDGSITSDDLSAVQKRLKKNMDSEEVRMFASALHAFPTRISIAKQNSLSLRANYKEEDIITVSNGPMPFEFSLGCQVTLRKNFNVSAGIVNGASGRILDFYQPTKDQKASGALEFILVHFPSYTGKVAVKTDKGVGLPIFRTLHSEFDDAEGVPVTSMRFMLELGFAITVHRSQGMTLPKLALCLGENEFAQGLRFVGFSRVKQMSDIMILDNNITMETLCPLTNKARNWRLVLKIEEERLKELQRKFLEKALK